MAEGGKRLRELGVDICCKARCLWTRCKAWPMTASTTIHPMYHSDSLYITSGSNTLRIPMSLFPKRNLKGEGQWDNLQPLPLAGGLRLSLSIIFLFYSHCRFSSPSPAPLLGSVAYLGGVAWILTPEPSEFLVTVPLKPRVLQLWIYR